MNFNENREDEFNQNVDQQEAAYAKENMSNDTHNLQGDNFENKEKIYKKKWFLLSMVFIGIFVVAFGFLFVKAGFVLNKVSLNGGIFESLTQIVSGKDELKGEENGRINVLLLGMRGKNVVGGGLLADTIMVASIDPINKKASLFSVPRDFYVTVPDRGFQSKINAVYFYGEEEREGKGMENMKKVIGEIVGDEIHYAATINFKGFEDLVDSIGGVDLHLDEPFMEPLQFKEEHVCDDKVFTVSSGNVQQKIDYRGKIVAEYPLCYNTNLECGGVFKVPAGDVTLNGENALCYVRARVTSSDFDRARRQQAVLQEIRRKATSAGTLSDFSKISAMLDSLGDNVSTDMKIWEMQRFFELYQGMGEFSLKQKVLENSEEGLLYTPEEMDPAVGYILLPRGENYSRIQEAFVKVLDKDQIQVNANQSSQTNQ
ncbi:MAG: LCP family protein [Candidatus Moranbacteria bacterium]|nr:LCP family protein [Candidatus Moranbacteria bacterium]